MIQLSIDCGLVVMIWMTQLVVYPSFEYFGEERLPTWHQKYTKAISIIVLPLMLIQLLIHVYTTIVEFSVLRLIMLALVGIIWGITFFIAVPLHADITARKHPLASAKKLLKINWYRTVLWTAVFVLGLFVTDRGQMF